MLSFQNADKDAEKDVDGSRSIEEEVVSEKVSRSRLLKNEIYSFITNIMYHIGITWIHNIS